MRVLVVAALLWAQAKADLQPKFQKVDTILVACTSRTEIKSSSGKDSKFSLELELSSEVEKVEGETARFACSVTRLKVQGTLDGRAVDWEWSKGGAQKGAKLESVLKTLEKGWRASIDRGGVTFNDEAAGLFDTLPLFDPPAALGFSTPLPFETVEIGKGWEVKDRRYRFSGGFSVKYSSALNQVTSDVARITSRLAFAKAEDELPIETPGTVKGDGNASLEYDLRSGRPIKGAASVRLTSTMGGQKRDITQTLEFEARH